VDYCRQLLMSNTGDASWKGINTDKFVNIIIAIDGNMAFELSKSLLPELAEYTDSLNTKKVLLSAITYLYSRLTSFLSDFKGASLADFEYLVDNASFCLFSYILTNPSFPVALFVENERAQNYINSDEVNQFALSHWYERRDEIAVYLRDKIPNSEHMSDEMVLSVAGVTL